MKLKDSTIKDFAEALGDDTIDDTEIGEASREQKENAQATIDIGAS